MPSRNDYLKAREVFIKMLEDETREPEWQKFFAKYPYVLSESLPLRIEPENLHALGRPGKSEPDFIFYPTKEQFQTIYGVIELKRPNMRILRAPRKNILRLSSDAQTALAQAEFYIQELGRQYKVNKYNMLALGNELLAFLILGLSNELANKVTNEILKKQYHKLLPQGFRLIPYDTLLKIFESRIPPQLYYIVPQVPFPISSIPCVDYSQGGYVTGIRIFSLKDMAGVRPVRNNEQDLFIQKQIGCCLYCGDMHGYNSLSKFFDTPAGIIQNFSYGIEDDKPYRILRCNKLVSYNGMPLEFREVYRKEILLNWMESLKNGLCGRCGSEDIAYYKEEKGFAPELDSIERWECNGCGLHDERHGWGTPSRGA